MSSAAPIRHIDLGDDIGEVEVTANGSCVTIHNDGRVDADARTPGRSPRVGDRMLDGSVYAGISPETGKALYTTRTDEPGSISWKQAMDQAAGLRLHGQQDWRLPTERELHLLFKERAAIGGFEKRRFAAPGWYWSSTEDRVFPGFVRVERFSDGYAYWFRPSFHASLRPVRSPAP